MKTGAEIGVMQPKAEGDKDPLDAERGLGQTITQSLQQEPGCQSSGVQHWGRMRAAVGGTPSAALAPAAPGHE